MHMTPVFLVTLAIILAWAASSAPNRIQPTWLRQINGWQKFFGIAGFILAMVILLNPELLALGLVGDAAFFDMLVLALSIQFQTVVFRAWRCIQEPFLKTLEFVFRGMRRGFVDVKVYAD
jgi:hypothetical protein